MQYAITAGCSKSDTNLDYGIPIFLLFLSFSSIWLLASLLIPMPVRFLFNVKINMSVIEIF